MADHLSNMFTPTQPRSTNMQQIFLSSLSLITPHEGRKGKEILPCSPFFGENTNNNDAVLSEHQEKLGFGNLLLWIPAKSLSKPGSLYAEV